MNNKLFSFLIVLMTLSLLGIIFVQGYWIKNSYDNREDQFTLNIRQVLISVSREIQLEEIEKYLIYLKDDEDYKYINESLKKFRKYYRFEDEMNLPCE